jgi:hypothetical protein
LAIYKKAMDLTIYMEKVVRQFSRYHKYTVGTELREKSRGVVGLIIKANSTVERLPVLLDLRERLEGLKVAMRIGKEVQAFSHVNAYVHASELVVDLSRQNEGWIKGQKQRETGVAGIPGRV